MSVFSGPNIVKDKLVFSVDANNLKSYDRYENLVLYSSSIAIGGANSSFYALAGNVIVGANTSNTTAPNGLQEATYLDNNGSTNPNYIFGAGGLPILSANTLYTYSIHIKQGTKPDFNITIDENSFGGKRYYVVFTYSTESVTQQILTGNTSNDGVITNVNHTKLTNGWYRLSLSFRTSNTWVGGFVDMIDRFGGTSGSNYVWGRQLEKSDSVNEYYPTTTSLKNRANTWLDISGFGTTANLVNGPTYGGGAIVFDGDTNRVDTNKYYSQFLTSFTQYYTLSAWVSLSSNTTEWDVLLGGVGYNAGLVMHTNNKFKFSHWYNISTSPAVAQCLGNTIATFGTWYNVVGVFDKVTTNTMKLYVNGKLDAPAFDIASFSDWNNYVVLIGGTAGLLQKYATFPGRIAYCQIYDKILSEDEISQNFNALRGRFGL